MGSYVLQQLGYNSPFLIVCLAGIGLSAVFVKKYSLPAMLTLAGTVILFVGVIAIAIAQGYSFRARAESGWTPDQYNEVLITIGAINGVVRAIGTALLIGAIFIGRKVKTNRLEAI